MIEAKTAVITGAGSGIGAAIAQELGGRGVRIGLVGRRRALLEEQQQALAEAGGNSVVLPADVRDFADVEAAVTRAVEQMGRVDVFVANAAVADYGPVDQADPALFEDVIVTNVLGVLYSARAVLPQMYRQGRGHIVIIASGSGRSTYVGEPAYIASKHAVIAFADCLRMEAAPRGVRVSVIEPGLVETPLIHVYPEAESLVEGVIPLQPADVARVVTFVLEQPAHCNVFEVALRPTTQQ
jgi:NADP-dependent 3-hydroxy acid dehydrogenase YdfG